MIWVADLADMLLISKYNKGTQFSWCVIDVIPLKDKNGLRITNAFQKILDKSGRKPNKIFVDNYEIMATRKDTEIHSAHNELKPAVAEKFMRKFNNEIYKYITSVLKNVYTNNELDDIVNKCNNRYHIAIKMKSFDIETGTHVDLHIEEDDADPKFKVGDHIRISKYKNIFAKDYIPNCSEEVIVIKKLKNTVPMKYLVKYLHGKEAVGTFYEKLLQKTNQTVFRVKNEIKKTGDKLDFKWKDNTICSIAGMIKMMLLYKISYHPVVQNKIVKLEAK